MTVSTTTDPAPSTARPARPLPPVPRKAPTRTPTAVVPSLILGLLLVAAAVLGVHDALVHTAVVAGPSWARVAADILSGLTVTWIVWVVGVVCVLAGLWFVVAALRPRPKVGVQVGAQSSVWVEPKDAGRLVHVAARRVTGVADLRVRASRRKVTVRVRGQVGTADVRSPIREAAQETLSGLRSVPRVVVQAPRPAAKAGGATRATASDEPRVGS